MADWDDDYAWWFIWTISRGGETTGYGSTSKRDVQAHRILIWFTRFESFFAMQEGVHAPARSWDIARSASMRPHHTPRIYTAKAWRKTMFFWISYSLLLYMGSGGKWFRVLVAEWNRLLFCFFAGIWNWGQPPFKPHHSLLIHKLHFVILLHLLLKFCISKLGCWTLFCSKECFRDIHACQIA